MCVCTSHCSTVFGSEIIPPATSHLASVMESPSPSNPLLSLSTFIHQHCLRLGTDLSARLDDTRRLASKFWPPPPPPLSRRRSNHHLHSSPLSPKPFASLSQQSGGGPEGKQVFDVALNTAAVAKTLAGTALYTVSNSNNEFVLISDPNGLKSIALLCFRRKDAEAFLAQVRSRRKEVRTPAKVVPIRLDQVYMLKVEGIAFRFLPDPVQIKNALELKASVSKNGFDGVPVFQSDLLLVKKKKMTCSPVYFCKEDIEKDLSKVPRAAKGPNVSQHIMVGSLEDVLRKMEMSEKKSGWEDLIFIPPGKTHSQHIQEIVKA